MDAACLTSGRSPLVPPLAPVSTMSNDALGLRNSRWSAVVSDIGLRVGPLLRRETSFVATHRCGLMIITYPPDSGMPEFIQRLSGVVGPGLGWANRSVSS